MSTKSTITYGDGYSMYTDLVDEGTVFIEVRDFDGFKWESSNCGCTIGIPIHVWKRLRQFAVRGDE